MKAKEYRALDAQKRTEELLAMRREQMNLRMQKATGQLANTSQMRKVRRDIARLQTVMNEKAK
jgi:large subunit ribosomal protein L29